MRRHFWVSQGPLWLVLYGALLAQSYRYQSGIIFYGEYLHWTGMQATYLLFALFPLRLAHALGSS